MSGGTERVSLSQAAEYLLEECRMVLPGIQALFGFQLIAVFNAGFHERLSQDQQRLHILAIALVAVAVAIIMTPAAYHRQHNPREVSDRFITISTRLMLASMLPLLVGICLDFYLIAQLVFPGPIASLLAAGLLMVFVVLWFVLPRVERLQKLLSGSE